MTKKIDTLADLTPDGENFNRHTEFGQKLLEDSLRKFGAGRSILVDKDGNIIAGNSTTETAAAIGMEDVIVVPTDGKKLVVVQRTDLSLDSPEGRELALADNMTALKGIDIDLAKVQETLGDDLAKAWGMDIPDVQKQAQEDDFDPDKPVETVCKKGDIWKLGNHRLMCGDSTDAASVALLMDGEKADGVLTDPPFGNDLGYGRGQLGERYIANDSDTKVLSSFFAPIDSVLKNNTHCLVWIQWRTFSMLEKAFEKYKLRTVVIWDKMQPGLSGGGFAEQYEMMCVFIKGHATQNEYCGNVWQISREHEKRSESEHPHKKPIPLLGKALNLCSHNGDLILDLFGGSGSTMIACEQLGRKCYMMELDPHYCDVIIARWEKLTGNKAERISNGNN